MADELQLKKLLGDIEEWNQWRQLEPDVKVDLSESSLVKRDLVGADLQNVDFSNADLSNADLSHTDLSGAIFIGANLDSTNLSEAIVYGADFTGAKLKYADVRGADFANVSLFKTDFSGTDLSEAKLYDISFEERQNVTVNERDEKEKKNSVVDSVDTNQNINKTVVLSAATALASLDEFVEQLRANNQVSVEYPEHKESLLEYLSRLREGLEELILAVDVESSDITDDNDLKSGYWYHLIKEYEHYVSAESRAKITVPAVLTVSCGTIGALLGGPIGFGAGSMAAAYLLGQTNSKAVTDKIEKVISNND
jgi:hypothetical protein